MIPITLGLMPAEAAVIGASIGAAVTAVGWFFSHQLTIEREIQAKKREQRIAYLVGAFRTISKVKAYDRMGELGKINDALQTAIADVQLFGTTEQVALLKAFVDSYVAQNINAQDILTSLRNDLRGELREGKVDETMIWLMVKSEGETDK
jgi:hypothetical protein